MLTFDYNKLDDQLLSEMLLICEDRLELAAAREMAARASMTELLSAIAADKHGWLAELPEFWAPVHASFILAYHGGAEVMPPLLAALRWADAFDCDWVTEAMPSMFGSLGMLAIADLSLVANDASAGWSARGIALQGLAAVSLRCPQAKESIFGLIGNIFMDEGQDRLLRQMAGNILLDFREMSYRMALGKFAREQEGSLEAGYWQGAFFSNDDVEFAFRKLEPEILFYQDDWMRFYDPREIQRRQKRWQKERLTQTRRPSHGSGGKVLSLWKPGDGPYKPEQE